MPRRKNVPSRRATKLGGAAKTQVLLTSGSSVVTWFNSSRSPVTRSFSTRSVSLSSTNVRSSTRYCSPSLTKAVSVAGEHGQRIAAARLRSAARNSSPATAPDAESPRLSRLNRTTPSAVMASITMSTSGNFRRTGRDCGSRRAAPPASRLEARCPAVSRPTGARRADRALAPCPVHPGERWPVATQNRTDPDSKTPDSAQLHRKTTQLTTRFPTPCDRTRGLTQGQSHEGLPRDRGAAGAQGLRVGFEYKPIRFRPTAHRKAAHRACPRYGRGYGCAAWPRVAPGGVLGTKVPGSRVFGEWKSPRCRAGTNPVRSKGRQIHRLLQDCSRSHRRGNFRFGLRTDRRDSRCRYPLARIAG